MILANKKRQVHKGFCTYPGAYFSAAVAILKAFSSTEWNQSLQINIQMRLDILGTYINGSFCHHVLRHNILLFAFSSKKSSIGR